MKRMTILGVPVDALSHQEAIRRLLSMIGAPGFHHVMTPNSEMIMEASRNAPFRELLNRTDLNLPDSAGLLWAARRTGQHLPERVTGVDTVTDLCAQLPSHHPVFFLGAWGKTAEKAAQKLQQKNPSLVIAGTYAGSPKDEDADQIIQMINNSDAQILLVAFGAPKQDLWIDKHRDRLPNIRLAMGVGGTFDFIAGVHKRAPLWMQKSGLEWLWRVIREPQRLPRIFNAVVMFPLKVLCAKRPLSDVRQSSESGKQ